MTEETGVDRGRIRLLFMGLPCTFSAGPFRAVLEAGFDVVGLVAPRLGARIPGFPDVPRTLRAPLITVLQPGGERDLVRMAWSRDIPVLEIGRLATTPAIDALLAYEPDVIAVACFPRRIPAAVLALPRLGCLNVHPSLLPANRGPSPLFWTFRRGDADAGVTIHLMDEGLDTGDILLQRTVPVPDGIGGDELERQCSAIGGELLVGAIDGVADGALTPRPQAHERATYHPAPDDADLVITPDRPARWAFNFARGALGLGYPVVVEVGDRRLAVEKAVAWHVEDHLDSAFELAGPRLRLRCSPGVLEAIVAAE